MFAEGINSGQSLLHVGTETFQLIDDARPESLWLVEWFSLGEPECNQSQTHNLSSVSLSRGNWKLSPAVYENAAVILTS
jgi:hypothetical protein